MITRVKNHGSAYGRVFSGRLPGSKLNFSCDESSKCFQTLIGKTRTFPVVFLAKIAIENVYSSREWALVERKLSVLKPVNDNILVFVQPCTNNNYRIIFLPDKNFASGRGSKKNSVFKVPI